MKKVTILIVMALSIFNLSGQCSEYQFRKPTLSSGTYIFNSVKSGVNAHITQTGSNNASINLIDDSTVYPQAWQPFIKFTNTTSNATDSSYVEFLIEFKKASNANDTQSCLIMTAVDLDGNSNFRELVKSSLPVNCVGSLQSLATWYRDSMWFSFFSGTTTYATIDTTNLDAMIGCNYTNVYYYKLRVGVVGIIAANTIREFSFYFKGFDSLYIPLPIKLIKPKIKPQKEAIQEDKNFYDNFGRLVFIGRLEDFIPLTEINVLYFSVASNGKATKYMRN